MGQPQSKGSSGTTNVASLPEFQPVKETNHPVYGKVQILYQNSTQNLILLKELSFNKKAIFEEKLRLLETGVNFLHPNLVQIVKYSVKEPQSADSKTFDMSVYLEVLNKDLETELRDRMKSRIYYTENELLLIAENICSALYNLDLKEKSHGDIRPAHIFVSGQTYKITNPFFEIHEKSGALARTILHGEKTLLSPQLLINVPEKIIKHQEDERKADVFSLGATLLAVATLTSSEEMYDYYSGAIDDMLLAERLQLVEERYSKYTFELISSMLNLDDHSRPDWLGVYGLLRPYQQDIGKKADLPFLETRHIVIREKDFLDVGVHVDGEGEVEHHIKAVAAHGEHEDEDAVELNERSDLAEDITIQKIEEHIAMSRQLRETQNFIKEEIYEPLATPTHHVETSALDWQVKSALEKSQDTYKYVYGGDQLSGYGHDLRSSGYNGSQEGEKWHKTDYRETLGLSPGYSEITKLSNQLIGRTHHLGDESYLKHEGKEHGLKSSGYETSYISAHAQAPDNASYTTSYGFNANLLKASEQPPKHDKYDLGEILSRPAMSFSYSENLHKRSATDNFGIGHTDAYKSSYIHPTPSASYQIGASSELRNIVNEKPPQSALIESSSHLSNESKTPSSADAATIQDLIKKYTSKAFVMDSAPLHTSTYSANDPHHVRSSFESQAQMPLVHDTQSSHEKPGRKSSISQQMKEYTPKYSTPHDIRTAPGHRASPSFDPALYSSNIKDRAESVIKPSSHGTSSPEITVTENDDIDEFVTDSRQPNVPQTPEVTGGKSARRMLEEPGTAVSKYAYMEDAEHS